MVHSMTESIRLDKYLAKTLSCSRGEAQQYIEGGWVLVDGRMVDEPQFMVQQQKVALHANAVLKPVEPATILLHKPVGVSVEGDESAALKLITAASHSEADETGITVLKRHFARLRATLPLETTASGLVVFTQDKRVLRKLSEDAARIEQEYVVEVTGNMAQNGVALLQHGLKFEGRALPPCKVSWQNEKNLRFALKLPQQGQIVDVCRQVGLAVVGVKRLRIGRVALAGVAVGQWRYLQEGGRF